MILNYIKIAFRNIYKNILFSLVNIGGLIVGITCFLIIFAWVKYELNFDNYYRNSDNIYRIIYKQNYQNTFIHSAVSPSPLGPTFKSEFPEVKEFTRYTIFFGEVLLSYKDAKYYENNGAYADPGFLDMFSVNFIKGSKENALEEPYSIILTESLAKKYFGDKDPLDEILYLENSTPLVVTGVIKDIPENSHLKFDFLVPYLLITKWGTNIDDWNNWAHQYSYVELDYTTDPQQFEGKIRNYLDKHKTLIRGQLYLQQLKDIHLNTSLNYDNYADLQNKSIVNIILIIGFVILIIACLNYINLTTAQYINRTKEVGIRKIVGASKLALIRQFLTESLIISLLSIYISLILLELLRTKIDVLNTYDISLNYGNAWTIITLVSITAFIGIISGMYPALFMAGQEPIELLKNRYSRRRGVISFRKVLVIIQFILASILVIISIYSYKQLHYIKNKNLGLDAENILAVQLRGRADKYDVLKEELLHNNNILEVSFGSSLSTLNSSTSDDLEWQGKANSDPFEVFSSSIDFDYMEMFNIRILKGRVFSKDFPSDADHSFIINESALKAMHMKNPIGQKIKFMGKEGQIIGVAEDFHFLPLYNKIQPLIITIRREWRYFLFAKITPGDYESTIKYINIKWNELFPGFPLKYEFVKEANNKTYLTFRKTIMLVARFTLIAILIALLGLYALTSYITKSKTKEIGIRKVVGATNKTILIMLNLDFLKIVTIAFIIASPLSLFIINQWMQQFAYKLNVGLDLFLISGVLILIIALITISIQVFSVARKNPVESLRYE